MRLSSFRSFKFFLKKMFIEYLYPQCNPKIVIAGTGRCASNLFARCVAQSYLRSTHKYLFYCFGWYISRLLVEYIEDLSLIDSVICPIVKTHDLYSPRFYSNNIKFIFIYGDPLLSAISVAKQRESRGDGWVNLHIRHLRGKGTANDIFCADALNFEGQLQAWALSDALKLRYPNYWEQQDIISKFLGFEFFLPLYIDRLDNFKDKSVPEGYKYSANLYSYLGSCEINNKSK